MKKWKPRNKARMQLASAVALAIAGVPAQAASKASASAVTLAPSARSEAIIGTGGNAIIGTGGEAIIGTGGEAIIGTGGEAIIGTGGEAIIGTGGEAIIGTGGEAIIGTGGEAIIGTGGDAIIGTGGNGFPKDDVFGPAISGPVEAIDRDGGKITVLGIPVRISSATRFTSADVSSLQLGDWVFVSGMSSEYGVSASTIHASSKIFVPGVSQVFVSGPVTEIMPDIGTVRIGAATINTVGVELDRIKAGDFVEVSGYQAQPHQVITPEVVRSSND